MNTDGLRIFILLGLIALFLSSCATARWTPDQLTSIKRGQSADSVIGKLGQPDSKKRSSDGTQAWEYRNPSSSRAVTNNIYAFFSLGMFSGKDSTYVDILRIKFDKKNRVKETTYDENQMDISGYMQPK